MTQRQRLRSARPCRLTVAAFVLATVVATLPSARAGAGRPASSAPAVERRAGPAGSLVMVEPSHVLPLVDVVVALRSGSAWDPRYKDGTANFAAIAARHGAAGHGRVELDARLAALGATLEVRTDADTVRFEGEVLGRNLDSYLSLVADILLRPDFTPTELARTRREILAALDEAANDDRALCARFFGRNLYSDHPYGHAPEGTRTSLERLRRDDLQAFVRRHVVGPNVVFAASGDTTPEDFATRVARHFSALPAGPAPGPNPLAVRDPQPPRGWRIQLIDKPDRRQAQIMFGQLGPRATDPDYVPLLVAVTSFGGRAMTATLMDEVRTKRGLAYGAYMTLSQRIGRGALEGWVFSSNERAVATLKLSLKLFVGLMDKGIDADRLAFTKGFLAGSQAAELDDPQVRLDARVTAEVAGLPPDFVDTLPARIRAVSADQVRGAIARHVRAHDLAITVVATAAVLRPRLLAAKIQPGAIDVVPFR